MSTIPCDVVESLLADPLMQDTCYSQLSCVLIDDHYCSGTFASTGNCPTGCSTAYQGYYVPNSVYVCYVNILHSMFW